MKLRAGIPGVACLWVGFLIALLLASLSITWELMAAQGFGYRTLHAVLKIDQTIAEFGPQNFSRPGFQLTDLNERQRLFEAIVEAIHHRGAGLESLVYATHDGRSMGKLLTTAEVIHLQDVARLVSVVRPVGWAAIVVVLLGSVGLRKCQVVLPGRKLLIGVVVLLILLAGLLTALGGEAIFYQLHRWVFPAGHQWFFYYEESLMSMMMQAPNLFGAVALIWALLAGLVMATWYWLVGRWLR